MKMLNILYIDGDEKKASSERFLSKAELKKKFGAGRISMIIVKQRRRYRLGQKSEGKYTIKKNYPKEISKGRTIEV